HVNKLQFLTELRLQNNSISGGVPSWLFTLPSLPILDLDYNKLVGPIDRIQKPSSIKEVHLNFSGCSVRQFPNFFQTSNLEELDLSNNMISGGISTWEAEGWEGLRYLDLSHNFLTALEQFPGNNLYYLNLHSNLLQGPILSTCLSPQIPILKELFGIIISKNKLTGNIPSSICKLSLLGVLDLSENSLSGTIPDCLGNLSSLKLMDLQVNNFYGKIPNSFVNNRKLSHLLLNDNQLEGLVPPSLANCTSLELLNLGNNKLRDKFPHWLASLSRLQVLILRFNRFYGFLPHSIASSDFFALRIFDLSENEFTGTLSTKLFRNLRGMKDKHK
ncbi:hypothetical protein Gohar_006161, partial [Gossypium harknessii]|nr:hypothetical protein [Gossypium harknessii]